jgi:glutathione S-transferase
VADVSTGVRAMPLQLYIGNKNYSSWSMRPWVLLRELGIAFDEVLLRLDFSPGSIFHQRLSQVSPAGRVPVLVDDGFAVWDTLAIAEYLHEKFPDAGVWPSAARERARARSLCAEMHAGFGALRQHCPMNIEASLPEVGRRLRNELPELRRDLERIDAMWREQLDRGDGPMLFGRFSAADAFYAPVCSRIATYALPVSETSAAYVARVLALPAVRSWSEAALQERDFVEIDEPYRSAR